jgi:hypothetical protein
LLGELGLGYASSPSPARMFYDSQHNSRLCLYARLGTLGRVAVAASP